jgi:hypothetical protein
MAKVKKMEQGTPHAIEIPPGECGTAGCPPAAGDCPEKQNEATDAATKTTPYSGLLDGTFGLEVLEESRVDLKDLRLNGTPEISFGDPRVVTSLAGGAADCSATRTNTVRLEVPFEIKNNGNVEIDLEAFTKLIVKAKGVTIDNNSFEAGEPQQPAIPPV